MTRLTMRKQLVALRHVLYALMLRDIQTRFGTAPGFLIAIAWPLSHILILVVFSLFAGRVAPYGDSAVLWFSVSMTPFMIISYTSRFMMLGLVVNRPLLQFPAISIVDILLSRVLIEIFVMSWVCLSLLTVFFYLDVDWIPARPAAAAAALLVSLLLGIGLGIVNGIVAMAWEKWVTVYVLITIILWITSGAYFVPSALPGPIRDLLYFHPIVHSIEWARTAWYESYSSQILHREYIVAFSIVTVFIGLTVERFLRGRLMYV
jgi:capsular polysaccharide transport system permease protein